ncbi:MAG TPA: BamA/TamA family outer membrane protein [Puia sp.]|nr:BamA/TamA family outer membrane protein [Puia sp.]
MTKTLLLILAIGLFPCFVFCQEDSSKHVNQDTTKSVKPFEQQDMKDWLIQKKWIKPKPPKNHFFLPVPIIASNPTAGFIFGLGFTFAYVAGKGSDRMSSVNASATYSTKKQVNLNMKSNLFASKDRLVLNGDWRYQVNNETTYGLGTRVSPFKSNININGYETLKDSLGDPLKYTLIRLHETGSWSIFKNFFAGIGFHYDHFSNISEEKFSEGDTVHSYHYNYSVKHGFDPDKYSIVGLSLNLLFDSRDNQVNPYKGYYGNLNFRYNPTGLGSTKSSSVLLSDFRTYVSFDQYHRHILAFWVYGEFVTGGVSPYLLLPALGYDQKQRSGRGYTFGQFRGEQLLYGETEYRFPISVNTGILGGVLFVNGTTTSSKDNNVKLFDYLRGAYGGGLRIMLDKSTRTRLEVDAGVANKSVGFYLGAQETF